jgi:ferredoxin--NADP+ reductase/benzoate/toluate 1,2-dioxygenase reductase subunit
MSKIDIQAMIAPFSVTEIRNLCDATYVVRFSKRDMTFRPGQHLVVGVLGMSEAREYSVYSGKDEEYLEIIVREVENGIVSRKLRRLNTGNTLEVNGPYGFFLTNAQPPANKKLLFIASGTGIAPFHSFVKTYPDADYTIIHGIRNIDEAYEKETYKTGRYISCTTRDEKGDFHGRLTGYLKNLEIDPETMVYLCGNSDMVFESIDILQEKGLSNSHIFTEVYF